MPQFCVDKLRVPNRRRHHVDSRLWREWCFLKVLARRFAVLAIIMAALLLGGAAAFVVFERDKNHSLTQATFFTWSLVFGEPPEEFPRHPVLQILFFIVPVIGLIVILDGIIEFSFALRDRKRSERSWCVAMSKSFSEHIVLVGMGRLGFQTFQLLRKLGEAVVVIERDAGNQFLEEVRRDGSPLFIGDARREALLSDVNVPKARSLLLCTTDDLANLEIALDARKINPRIRVVLRMFDQNMADKVRDGFNIHTAMSQSALSAPTFAMAAVDGSILNTQIVGDRLVVTQRWLVRHDGPLCDMTVGDVLREYSFSIVEQRAADARPRLFPPPDARLKPGDQLIVQGPYDALMSLRRESRPSTMITGAFDE